MAAPPEAKRRIGERFAILNEYGEGVNARLDTIIQNYNADTRPACFKDKSLDTHIKAVIKKFPAIDEPKQSSPLFALRENIQEQLGDAYGTLIDWISFHQATSEFFADLTDQQFVFDVSINTILVTEFLKLVVTHITSIELVSRFSDRKLVAGIYNCTYQLLKGVGEPFYPQLARMLVQFDVPFKRLPEFYEQHGKMLSQALSSLKPIFDRKMVDVGQLRKSNPLSLAQSPQHMLKPPELKNTQLDVISAATLIQWVCIGYLVLPQELAVNANALDMVTRAMKDGSHLPLFRDQSLNVFRTFEVVFGTTEGKKSAKQKKTVMETESSFHADAANVHSQRRDYLRNSLRQLCLIIQDKPGLLGPKLTVVISALNMARDEIFWLYRHKSNENKKLKGSLEDKQFAELLFYTTELRDTVLRYGLLVKRYYTEFLCEADSQQLRAAISSQHFESYEQLLISAFFDVLEDTLEQHPDMPLNGMRLDCHRLLAAMSVVSAKHSVAQNEPVAHLVNAIHFHSQAVDNLSNLVQEACCISNMWFFKDMFVNMFTDAIKDDDQNRFILSFASACSSFPFGGNRSIPGEEISIGNKAADIANHVLQHAATKAVNSIDAISESFGVLASHTLPAQAVSALEVKFAKDKNKHTADLPELPGVESQSYGDESVQHLRTMHDHLSDVCWALNHNPRLLVHNIEMRPAEYLTRQLEESFANTLVKMLKGPSESVPARPSVVLDAVQAYMGVLRHVESYIDIDIISLFSAGLLQQTLVLTAPGRKTHATQFVDFYRRLVLRMVPQGGIIIATSRKAMCSLTKLDINPAEYTDIGELQALCSLIGPYGVKQLNDSLMEKIFQEMTEIKRIVQANKTELDIIKLKTAKTEMCENAMSRIRDMPAFIEKCKMVGTILVFRRMISEQMRTMLKGKIPFMFEMINDWHTHMESGKELNALAFAAGIESDVDPFLEAHLQPLCGGRTDADLWGLMMVMCAASLKSLASDSETVFNPQYDAHENNVQVLAVMINQISSVIFTLTAPSKQAAFKHIVDAQTDFLRIASILLLRLGDKPTEKTNSKSICGRDAVYVIMDKLVKESPFVTDDVLEEHFPYSLVRTSLHEAYKQVA
eukprot:m.82811 g.82811  ORF g.82811 m.82811 type:complete len:1109 (-) comp25559_c0_seq1:97-3423(-)